LTRFESSRIHVEHAAVPRPGPAAFRSRAGPFGHNPVTVRLLFAERGRADCGVCSPAHRAARTGRWIGPVPFGAGGISPHAAGRHEGESGKSSRRMTGTIHAPSCPTMSTK
jgi:hypothetical protein